jgi:hypothetical protein
MTVGAHLTINLKLNFSSVQIDDLWFFQDWIFIVFKGYFRCYDDTK